MCGGGFSWKNELMKNEVFFEVSVHLHACQPACSGLRVRVTCAASQPLLHELRKTGAVWESARGASLLTITVME